MKHILGILIAFLFLTTAARADEQKTMSLEAHLQAAASQGMNNYLAAPDKFGTPLIIKLARQGDTNLIGLLSRQTSSASFLLAKDFYGNTVFHVAKNAATIQTLAASLRQHPDPKISKQFWALLDARNLAGETPLYAQINAGHVDASNLIFNYSSLKTLQPQITRLQGMDERIAAPIREDLCEPVRKLGSVHGRTILQAAQFQAQTTQQPGMWKLVNDIQRDLPCLAL